MTIQITNEIKDQINNSIAECERVIAKQNEIIEQGYPDQANLGLIYRYTNMIAKYKEDLKNGFVS